MNPGRGLKGHDLNKPGGGSHSIYSDKYLNITFAISENFSKIVYISILVCENSSDNSNVRGKDSLDNTLDITSKV